jgi:hypothetical protein
VVEPAEPSRTAPEPRRTLPYPLVCTLLGLALGWLPMLVHGPHPYKFTVWHLNGAIAVWAFYSARLLIGFHVGVTRWPARWWLRGPLYGFLTMLPVTFVALANPLCGWT